jgi:hypothetical protein
MSMFALCGGACSCVCARVMYAETICNPTMRVGNVAGLGALKRALVASGQLPVDAIVMVDSTFATPYLIRPLTLPGRAPAPHTPTHARTAFPFESRPCRRCAYSVLAAQAWTLSCTPPPSTCLGTRISPRACWRLPTAPTGTDARTPCGCTAVCCPPLRRFCWYVQRLVPEGAGHPVNQL